MVKIIDWGEKRVEPIIVLNDENKFESFLYKTLDNPENEGIIITKKIEDIIKLRDLLNKVFK